MKSAGIFETRNKYDNFLNQQTVHTSLYNIFTLAVFYTTLMQPCVYNTGSTWYDWYECDMEEVVLMAAACFILMDDNSQKLKSKCWVRLSLNKGMNMAKRIYY